MKTVKFKRLFDGRTYGVLTTDIETEWDKDHSGTYVLLTEADAEIAALRERQRVLADAVNVGLKRNHIITDAEDFKQHLQGTWVAIPEQNFDHIRAALAAKEG